MQIRCCITNESEKKVRELAVEKRLSVPVTIGCIVNEYFSKEYGFKEIKNLKLAKISKDLEISESELFNMLVDNFLSKYESGAATIHDEIVQTTKKVIIF